MDDSAVSVPPERAGKGRAAERAGGVDRASGGADCGTGRVGLPAAEDLKDSGLPPPLAIRSLGGAAITRARPNRVHCGRARRSLADAPDETIKRLAATCPQCAADVSGQTQSCRHRYDYIDIPPIAIELFGGRCNGCGRRFRALAPAGMAPGSPFGAGSARFVPAPTATTSASSGCRG